MNKPMIALSATELNKPIKGLEPFVDNNTRFLILGTFPAQESIDAGFYYENQSARFWGQALNPIGHFEGLTISKKSDLLLKNKIGLWGIFEFIEKKQDSNKDSDIKAAVYSPISRLLEQFSSIEYLLFNGKTTYEWLQKDKPDVFKLSHLRFEILQSSSGSNGHFQKGADWKRFWENKV